MDVEENITRNFRRGRRDIFVSLKSMCYWPYQLICTGYNLVRKYKKRSLAILFFLLEGISIVLDQLGRSKLGFLFAAFVLSELGFALTLYTSFKVLRANPSAAKLPSSESQLVVVELVFSVIQLIATFAHFILAVLDVKNNVYNATVFPIAFAIIAVVFAFRETIHHGLEEIRINNSSSENSPDGYLPIYSNSNMSNNSNVLIKSLADFVHKPMSSPTSFAHDATSSHASFLSSSTDHQPIDHNCRLQDHNYRLQKIEAQLTGTDIEIKYIDLTKMDCYGDFFTEMVEIFNIAGELWGPSAKWDVFYLDFNYNIRVLIGDISWDEFCDSVRKIYIHQKL